MSNSFVLRAEERGHNVIYSDGAASSYLAGHPGSFLTRDSSFNFGQYQSGRPGFGTVRVFGDEVFHGAGCGYNMHPHHNFVICAFVLEGELTHINTAGRGMVDQLRQGDFYVFTAGSGGKHAELSVSPENMNAIYLWLLPSQLYLPPSYVRGHFDLRTRRDQIVQLVGDADGALPIAQDFRVSRLVTDKLGAYVYTPRSSEHGVYVFVAEGKLSSQVADLGRRDSFGVSGLSEIRIEVADSADVFFVETAMIDDARVKAWEKAQGDDLHH